MLVPHLQDAPLTLKRYPDGVDGQHFYEKHSPSHRPDWVKTATVGRAERSPTARQDRPTLVWLANLADIELHTPLSRAARLEQPTTLVFDLDPGAPAGIVECCEVALVLRGLFEQLGCQSFVKTSGSKGMQMYVPLNTPVTLHADQAVRQAVAELLEAPARELVTSRMTKRAAHRKGARRLEPERRAQDDGEASTRCARASGRRSRRR